MWWDKYCRRYPEFAPTQKNIALFKGTANIRKLTLMDQDKMKSRFYQIKCTAASDQPQVLNCQPKSHFK
jgi:hypothetical protein